MGGISKVKWSPQKAVASNNENNINNNLSSNLQTNSDSTIIKPTRLQHTNSVLENYPQKNTTTFGGGKPMGVSGLTSKFGKVEYNKNYEFGQIPSNSAFPMLSSNRIPSGNNNNNRNNNVLPSIGLANNKPLWQAGGGATLGSFRNQRNLGNNAGQKKKNWFSGGQNAGSRGPRGQFGRLNLKE